MMRTRWTASVAVAFLSTLVLCTSTDAQVVPQPGILCDDMFNSEGGLLFAPTGFGGVVPCTFPDRWPGDFLAAHDPNDKVGPRGVGSARFITGRAAMAYAVYFENLPTATAPAQEVFVTDDLDAAHLNLETLSLGPITFGTVSVVPPPGLSEFTKDVDLRPGQNLIVRITARLDRATGRLSWSLVSIDPATGQLPEDPLNGFLPPNTNPPAGDGAVFFTVEPRVPVATGTTTCNRAAIVFDLNAPIVTPDACNTFDNSAPASQVLPLAATQLSPSFNVSWSGSDDGSGIERYSVFVSENGGPFTPFLVDTGATSASFTGQRGSRYDFFSVAGDRTGNEEGAPASADASTIIVNDTTAPITSATLSTPVNAAGWHRADVTVTLSASDAGGTGVREITYTTTGAQPGGPITNPGASASLIVSAEGTTTVAFSAVDRIGNAEAARVITVRLDKTSPVITIDTPPIGASYQANQSVNAAFGCLDAVSGLAACAGSVPVGVPIDTSTTGTRNFTVNAVDIAGNAAIVLRSYTVTPATPSPAGDRIAFESDRDGNFEIYTMDSSGTNPSRLTVSGGADLHPAWSPDRRRLAFTSFRNGNAEIYVMNGDGTGQTRLTVGAAVDDDAAWSPDGARIAFWSSRDGNPEIYVMDANGANQQRLTFNSRIDLQPAWAPDGARLVFASNRDSRLNMDLYTMNADGSGVKRLTTHAAIDESPAWSPDGNRIVFSSNRTGLVDFEIWSVNANGGAATPLTSAPHASVRPAWSRDGTRISFATNRDTVLNFEVYTMRPDGSDARRLTRQAGLDLAPNW